MNQFIFLFGQLIGWSVLLGGFIVYLLFQDEIAHLSKSLILVMTLGLMVLGSGFILGRSYKKYKDYETDRVEGDSYVHITPQILFLHDLIALLTFGSVIIFSQLFSESFSAADIIKATIAGGGVYSLKWIYKDSFRA